MKIQLQRLDGASYGHSAWKIVEEFNHISDIQDYLEYPTQSFDPIAILRLCIDGVYTKRMFHDGSSCVDARDVMKDECWNYSADSRNFAEKLDYLTAYFACEKAPWLIWATSPYLDNKIVMSIVRRCLMDQLATRNTRVNQIHPTLQAVDRWLRGEMHSYEVECIANTMTFDTSESYENLMSQAVHFLAMGAKAERPNTYLTNGMFSLCHASSRGDSVDAFDGSMLVWAGKLKEYISIHDVGIGIMRKHSEEK